MWGKIKLTNIQMKILRLNQDQLSIQTFLPYLLLSFLFQDYYLLNLGLYRNPVYMLQGFSILHCIFTFYNSKYEIHLLIILFHQAILVFLYLLTEYVFQFFTKIQIMILSFFLLFGNIYLPFNQKFQIF